MPTYTFKCEQCQITLEETFSVYSNATIWCSPCQIPMIKQFSAPAIHFKGDGWGKSK